jgi:ABC-2 type transport system permease protein
MAVMSAFNLASAVAYSCLREHDWRTWNRLRLSPAASLEIMLGKAAAALFQACFQITVLFGISALALGLSVRGSVCGLVLVALSFSACVIAIGFVLAAFGRTIGQVFAATNLVGLVLGGLGGALIPLYALPQWVKVIAPLNPVYWAMQGYQAAVLERGGVIAVLPATGALAAFSTTLLIVSTKRFRSAESGR